MESREQADQDKYDYVEGIVADVINADSEYATIIEAALEGKTDALVINSTSKFLADSQIEENLKSRIKVICADKIEPFVDTSDLSVYSSVKGRLIEFVSYESKYAQLA